MAELGTRLTSIYSLEQLSAGGTVIHRVHPLAKMAVTAVYLVCVASFGRYELGRLTPYLFYPALVMALAEIPYGMVFKRGLVALPFCLFAGISNLLLDRRVLFRLGSLCVTGGAVSLLALLLRAMLCVGAALILVAVTPFAELTGQLRRLRVPELLVMLVEMTYRYLAVLAREASGMVTAFRLRGNGRKWPDVRQFGPFVGQLLLRSAGRAQRVSQAMQCRLYGQESVRRGSRPWKTGDTLFLLLGGGTSLFFRFVDVAALLGGIFP